MTEPKPETTPETTPTPAPAPTPPPTPPPSPPQTDFGAQLAAMGEKLDGLGETLVNALREGFKAPATPAAPAAPEAVKDPGKESTPGTGAPKEKLHPWFAPLGSWGKK